MAGPPQRSHARTRAGASECLTHVRARVSVCRCGAWVNGHGFPIFSGPGALRSMLHI
jgi:hypothetical protein